MPHRRMTTWVPDLKDWFGPGMGELTAATMSQTPEEYIDQMYVPSERCPVCGTHSGVAESISVSVNATFHESLRLGLTAWAHIDCFDSCPLIKETPPIPC
jgi:hypothetical protein